MSADGITKEMVEAGIAASFLRPKHMYPRYTEQELAGIVRRVYAAMEEAKNASAPIRDTIRTILATASHVLPDTQSASASTDGDPPQGGA